MIAAVIRRPRGGLWDNPDFLRLWVAQSLSAIGTRFTREGLPIIAALTLGASATDLGLLVALSALPGVIVSPFVGALDRPHVAPAHPDPGGSRPRWRAGDPSGARLVRCHRHRPCDRGVHHRGPVFHVLPDGGQ